MTYRYVILFVVLYLGFIFSDMFFDYMFESEKTAVKISFDYFLELYEKEPGAYNIKYRSNLIYYGKYGYVKTYRMNNFVNYLKLRKWAIKNNK